MKKDYMTRLERAARWRLPPREAEDVISDYREMVGGPPRPEEELLRDLGKPRDAIRSLVRPKQYRIWLAVFLVMSFCVLSLGFSPTTIGYPIWLVFFDPWHPWGRFPGGPYIAAVLGVVTALVWFRWQGQKQARLPKAIPVLLAVLLAWCGGAMLLCWLCLRNFDGFLNMWGTIKPFLGPGESVAASFYLLRLAMAEGCGIMALAGEVGLVKARIGDRRWAAVYILALSAIMTSVAYVSITGSMDPIGSIEEVFQRLLILDVGITAVGIIGAGVALC